MTTLFKEIKIIRNNILGIRRWGKCSTKPFCPKVDGVI
ncbi:hypothetical protein Desmer_1900 [Desulfosporosinus meridiei DSM 13257]|uniref:Uncharacterized protein n=1 Tax=Desulfosporosinus meridiei (strain ATCC BAA-275 / DSM 13257 / KCTC 12902 / NCIMB 13706 / S10) TaxID=768704 RepID=J7IYU2_DESMD|nr:hypothetical protein Desmer_1900 [Desulfosporosinus meridiei DSM 13257]